MSEQDNKFDVSRIGDTVIRDYDSGEIPKDIAEMGSGSKEDVASTARPHHTFADKDGSFDVSRIGDTVIRDRDSGSLPADLLEPLTQAEPPSEHPYRDKEPESKETVHDSADSVVPPFIDSSM